MLSLVQTMESGTLVQWLMEEGSELAPGEVMAEVQTDKATVDFECQDEGFLAKILVPGGTEDVKIGQAIAVSVEDADTVSAFAEFSLKDVEGAADAPAPAPASAPAPAPEPSPAPAPAPSPAPAPAPEPAPAPAPAPSPAPEAKPADEPSKGTETKQGSAEGYTPWNPWGSASSASPLFTAGVGAKVAAYHDAFGDTLTGPPAKQE